MSLPRANRKTAVKPQSRSLLTLPSLPGQLPDTEHKPTLGTRLSRLRWQGMWITDLAIAAVMGLLYALIVVGTGAVNPKNVGWLAGDTATNYIGWALFRADPVWWWPLTFTNRVGYPLGESASFLDVVPLWALLLKPLSPLLPTPFQYLGLVTAVACGLQFFFAVRLFRLFYGDQLWPVLLPSLFFLISPPMTWRFVGHYALSNHWLLTAALYFLYRAQGTAGWTVRGAAAGAALLTGVAVATTPYLAVMAAGILFTGVVGLLSQRRIRWAQGLAILASMAAAGVMVGLACGFVRADGYGGAGYRQYSMNVLAPLDPGKTGGLFLTALPSGPAGQYEGYNYLGLGVLLLMAVLVVPAVRYRPWRHLGAPRTIPLLVCSAVFTVLAFSTQVWIGSSIAVDLDPREVFSRYLASFRGSGRFFWVPYYVILLAVLHGTFQLLRRRTAAMLVIAAFVLQVIDTAPLRAWVRQTVSATPPMPLKSPVWSSLGRHHRNLMVLPPFQCGDETPGGPDGFRIFGMLAAGQTMRINSYYAARYGKNSLVQHCGAFARDLLTKGLDPDSAYVVNRPLAALIAAGPAGPRTCHVVDGFTLCSARTDFGLGAGLDAAIAPMKADGKVSIGADAESVGFLTAGWHNRESWGVWNAGSSAFQFRLRPEQTGTFHTAVLHIQALVGPEPMDIAIQSGRHKVQTAFQGESVAQVKTTFVRVPLGLAPGGWETILLMTSHPVLPLEFGMTDNRILGIGLLDVVLEP